MSCAYDAPAKSAIATALTTCAFLIVISWDRPEAPPRSAGNVHRAPLPLKQGLLLGRVDLPEIRKALQFRTLDVRHRPILHRVVGPVQHVEALADGAHRRRLILAGP